MCKEVTSTQNNVKYRVLIHLASPGSLWFSLRLTQFSFTVLLWKPNKTICKSKFVMPHELATQLAVLPAFCQTTTNQIKESFYLLVHALRD